MKLKAKSLKIVVISLTMVLLIALTLGITGAYYGFSQDAKGDLLFNQGIYVEITNIDLTGSSTEGTLKYYADGNESGTAVALSDVSSDQNQTYKIAKPQIVSKAGSKSFVARAKFEYKFYVTESDIFVLKTAEELGTTNEALLSSLIAEHLIFASNWNEATDGYYYYSSSLATNSSLIAITENQTIDIFSSNTLTTGSWEALNGGPFGISKFEIILKIDIVEESAKDNWTIEPVGLLNLAQYKITDTSGVEIDSNTSLNSGTRYHVVDRTTENGYKILVSQTDGNKTCSITRVVGSPTELEICSTILWNGENIKTTGIGADAFSGCTGLTSIEIPSSVTSIGNYAFHGCTGLISIEIPSSVTSIGNSAFHGCTGLTSIEMPSSVTSIGMSAFSSCTSLTSVEIPNSVTSIGKSAFIGCTGLTRIEIPNSVTSIGTSAFSRCTSLSLFFASGTYSTLDNGRLLMKGNEIISFAPSGITSYTIPSSVTSIGNYAFHGCASLTSISIPGSVTSIGNYAYLDCTGLSNVILAEGLISIGADAFSGCTGLTSIEIPNSVTSISAGAFIGCTGLTSIEIPNSVTSIGKGAFSRCTSLSLFFASGTYSTLDNGRLLMKGNEIISFAPSGITSYTIPSSVTSIGNEAFHCCAGLTSISIPGSVTSIGDWAFVGCTSLTTITLLGTEPPTLGSNAIPDNVATINIPSGSLSAYQSASGWSSYASKFVEV